MTAPIAADRIAARPANQAEKFELLSFNARGISENARPASEINPIQSAAWSKMCEDYSDLVRIVPLGEARLMMFQQVSENASSNTISDFSIFLVRGDNSAVRIDPKKLEGTTAAASVSELMSAPRKAA